MTVLAAILVLAGLLFLTVAVVGLLRLPDFFARVHAAGKSDTLGGILLLGGLALYHGANLESVKLLLILGFLMVANPTAIHALARAAYRSGMRPWTRAAGESRPQQRVSGGE